ncbi:hypothetical protein ACXXDK_06065 [Deinococcus sp. PESE-38]
MKRRPALRARRPSRLRGRRRWGTVVLTALAVLGIGRSQAQGPRGFPFGLGPVLPARPLFAPPCAAPQSRLQRAVWEVTTSGAPKPT